MKTLELGMDLSDYERRKFELAEILRSAAVLRPKRKDSRDDEIQELFARLAEDRFNLVVVGRFSRGKSSLMNTILGEDWLPTGIAPLTSVITAVCYGSEECVSLTFESNRLGQEIKLSELPQYVTQEGNPGNVRRVKIAEIQLPAEILRRGFYFIDTPGLGSAIMENTETTEGFLPAADAFLLVTGYESPLSDDEFRFLRETAPSAKRIFVAVNKQDTIRQRDERDRALAYVRQQLATIFGAAAPHVFSTSAMEGLKAKQANDKAALDESGIAALEEELIRFLVSEKSEQFLLRMCFRLGALVQGLPPSGEAEALGSRLEAFRQEIGAGPMHRPDRVTPGGIGGLAPAHSEQAGSCEFCRAVENAIFDFLSQYQYALTVSSADQEQLARDGGLCRLHTWSYNSVASPHGVCIGYPGLLERWATALSAMAQTGASSAAQSIKAQRPDADTCSVCRACAEAEAAALSAVAAQLRGGRSVDDLSAICLDHLAMLLPKIGEEQIVAKVILRQAGLFERIAEDMRRYALKFDGIRRHLASRAEERSSARGLRIVAGLPNISYVRGSDVWI